MTFNYKTLSLYFMVTFNTAGEVIQMETKRYMDEKSLETWVIKMGDYKAFGEVRVPTFFEVLWRLDKGDFPYAKFRILKIEYNIPQAF